MSYVIATPEMMSSAATDLATIGSNVSAAHMVAAAPTTAILPAAADEVSASIANLFSQHAASYRSLAGQATAFHEQFVQNLTASAHSYAAAEAANAALIPPFPQWFDQSVQSARNWYAALPGPQQNLVNAFFFAVIGLPVDLGLFIVLAPIIIPLLPIIIAAGAA